VPFNNIESAPNRAQTQPKTTTTSKTEAETQTAASLTSAEKKFATHTKRGKRKNHLKLKNEYMKTFISKTPNHS